MFYRRTGFPDEDELVLCTVTKVFPHAVFCNLDEFDRSGVIHISEIAPGRIRNIRNYVKEGKKVICKVLRVNQQKGHIDLSLRRVNEAQRRNKNNEIKQEQLAEKILEFVARREKIDIKKFYDQITDKVFEKYSSLYECFEEVVNSKITLVELGIDVKSADDIIPIIHQRIKPPEVEIEGSLNLISQESNGIEIIKEALKLAQDTSEQIFVRYISAGHYHILVKAGNYQDAEKILKEAVDKSISFVEENKGTAEFIKKK